MSKVAQVTVYFWIMKICATTLGETAGDLLSMTLNVGYAISSVILLALFIVTLAMQLRSKAFHPVLFWMVILSTSTAGTTMSDYMDRTLGLGYATGKVKPLQWHMKLFCASIAIVPRLFVTALKAVAPGFAARIAGGYSRPIMSIEPTSLVSKIRLQILP